MGTDAYASAKILYIIIAVVVVCLFLLAAFMSFIKWKGRKSDAKRMMQEREWESKLGYLGPLKERPALQRAPTGYETNFI